MRPCKASPRPTANYSRCGTTKIPACSTAVSTEQRPSTKWWSLKISERFSSGILINIYNQSIEGKPEVLLPIRSPGGRSSVSLVPVHVTEFSLGVSKACCHNSAYSHWTCMYKMSKVSNDRDIHVWKCILLKCLMGSVRQSVYNQNRFNCNWKTQTDIHHRFNEIKGGYNSTLCQNLSLFPRCMLFMNVNEEQRIPGVFSFACSREYQVVKYEFA